MKTKRKMPPHIVLPNGQWRFVKRGSKKHHASRSNTMAKRKGGFRRGSAGLNIFKLALPFTVGVITGATKVSQKIPFLNTVPMNNEVGGFVAGVGTGMIVKSNPIASGAAGAAGAWVGANVVARYL